MQNKEHIVVLGDGARKRHWHATEQGRVVAFMVQLEIWRQGIWTPVLRYDSAHGFSHVDRYNLKEEQEKEVLDLP